MRPSSDTMTYYVKKILRSLEYQYKEPFSVAHAATRDFGGSLYFFRERFKNDILDAIQKWHTQKLAHLSEYIIDSEGKTIKNRGSVIPMIETEMEKILYGDESEYICK